MSDDTVLLNKVLHHSSEEVRSAWNRVKDQLRDKNQQLIEVLRAFLLQLPKELRYDLFHTFCTNCGDESPYCQCDNDE